MLHIRMNDRATVSVFTARIVLFGSEGGFSRPVLDQLLSQGINVVAVVMPDIAHVGHNFPVKVEQPVKPNGLVDVAIKNRVPILRMNNLHDKDFISQLTEKQADVLLVACFPLKIPTFIWQHTNTACWNLHPSLLPKYRGPVPLYWQLRNNELETGLTLHEVSNRFDAGDILARQALSLPANVDATTLDEWVAEHGVRLFHKTLDLYLRGDLKSEPQDETIASYFPYPDKEFTA